MDRVNLFLNNWGQDLDVVWVEEKENFQLLALIFVHVFTNPWYQLEKKIMYPK